MANIEVPGLAVEKVNDDVKKEKGNILTKWLSFETTQCLLKGVSKHNENDLNSSSKCLQIQNGAKNPVEVTRDKNMRRRKQHFSLQKGQHIINFPVLSV